MARDKGTGGLHKRKSDGMWVATIELPRDIDGKRRRKQVVRKNRGDAQKELRALQLQLADSGNLVTRKQRLADWLDTYMTKIAPYRLSAGTLYDRESVIRLFIKPLLGKKYLENITVDDVRNLTDTIIKTPRDPKLRGTPAEELPPGTPMLSSSYARNAHNTLSAALEQAVKDGKLRTNVAKIADRPAPRQAVDNALTQPQFLSLIRALADDKDKALWLTFLLTGARRGEVAGLEVQRVANGVIDFSAQLKSITDISLSRQADYDYVHISGKRYLVRPKTTSSKRVTPMPAFLARVLEEHIGSRTTGFVFTNNRGEPYDPSTIGRMWKKLLRHHNLPSHVTLHGARHTFVDMLYNANSGVREDTIMQLVGHSSRAMTRSYRQNIGDVHAVQAMGSLDDLVAGDFEVLEIE